MAHCVRRYFAEAALALKRLPVAALWRTDVDITINGVSFVVVDTQDSGVIHEATAAALGPSLT